MPADRTQIQTKLSLRLLCTTDLHMVLTGDDVLRNCRQQGGLESIAPLIRQLRDDKSVDVSLVLDNGDALQGTALADWIVNNPDAINHPMYRAFEALGYDAITIGNHDLDFGLSFLKRAVNGTQIPVLCANLITSDGDSFLPPYRIIEKELPSGGTVRLGLTGFLPPRTGLWNRHHMDGILGVRPVVEAVSEAVSALRAQGADLIIVLAHSGIEPDMSYNDGENEALAVAQIDDVDVIIAGHQHLRFPSKDFASAPGIDPKAGTLNGKPAIMAGFWGNCLGCIDLSIRLTEGKCHVEHHTSTFLKPLLDHSDPALQAIAKPHISAMQNWLSEPLSHTAHPLNTHFCSVEHAAPVRLMQAAMIWKMQQVLSQIDMPMIAAASAYRSGGRSGPGAYTQIAAGPLTRRDVVDICPYANQVTVVQATGRQLRDWLEMSAAHYNLIPPQPTGRDLIGDELPGYNFDTLLGLTYEIDPSSPAKFDVSGRLVGMGSGRIRSLRYQGRPLNADMKFSVAVSSYRAAGGGSYPGMNEMPVIVDDMGLMSDILTGYLQAHPDGINLPDPAWILKAGAPRIALYKTGAPQPPAHLPNVQAASPIPDKQGWYSYSVSF